MKKKLKNQGVAGDHPRCRLCRDGTYAVMSLKIFPEGDCGWTHYCDPCGNAMASVVKDGQKRDPPRKDLPPPPPEVEVSSLPPVSSKPPEAGKKPLVKGGKGKPSPEPVKSPETPPKAPTLKSALKNEGHDLLELMGWKK